MPFAPSTVRHSFILATVVTVSSILAAPAALWLGASMSPLRAGRVVFDVPAARLSDQRAVRGPDLEARIVSLFGPYEEPAVEVRAVVASLDKCRGLRLIASLTPGLAVVAGVSAKPVLVRVGDRLGAAEVLTIETTYVAFREDGEQCEVQMFAPHADNSTEMAPPERTRVAPAIRDIDLSTGPRVVETQTAPSGRARSTPARATVRSAGHRGTPSSLAEGLRHVRVVPRDEDGVRSWALYGIRRGSLLQQLGLQNGDRLREVGGQPLGDLDEVMSSLAAWRAAPELRVGFVRRGEFMEHTYAFESD